MGWFSHELIPISKVTYRRLMLLVEEVEELSGDDVFPGLSVSEKSGNLATKIIEEYVKRHFLDTTRQVATMFDGQHTAKRRSRKERDLLVWD